MNGQFPIGNITPWQYFSSMAFVFGCFLALQNTDTEQHWLSTFVQWQAQTFSALGFFVGAHLLLDKQLSRFNAVVKLLISAFFASLLYTPVSLLIDVYWQNEAAYNWYALKNEWIDMVPSAMFGWGVINLPWLLGFSIEKPQKTNADLQTQNEASQVEPTSNAGSHQSQHDSEQSNTSQALVDFKEVARIDDVQELVYLKAELHYLKVVTDSQSQLILFNLKDAVALLAEIEPKFAQGQTHRGFWVNVDKIQELKRNGREGALVMNNSEQVLVSRSHMPKVKTWFENAQTA